MKFIQYINHRLQVLVLEAAKRDISTARGAEIDALQFVFSVYRFVFAGIFIPKVLFCAFLVMLGLKKMPAPSLDLLKASHDAETLAHKNKSAKKLGFSSAQKIAKEFN